MEDYINVGKITNVHGLMGEVRVDPWADSPDFLKQFKTLYVGDTHWPIEVLGCRGHKRMAILKLNGITDVNSALAVRNQVLSFLRSDANLPEGHFFISDIIGIEARDAETGDVLGTLAEVLPLPAHNVYAIRGGEREILVPAVPAFIEETNIPEKYIKIRMMDGL